MSVAGEHVLVTGGSSGIGLALVDLLHAARARVTVLALDDADLASLRLAHPDVRCLGVDVTDAAAVDAAVASVPHVDRLVTCAGITKPSYVRDLALGDFRAQMEVNYFGTLHAVRAVLPGMVDAHAGSITCISSAAGLLGVFGYAAYVPSKFAVRGLCETLRVELRPHGVTVTCVYPADVDTPMLAGERPLMPPELVALNGRTAPVAPAVVARAVLAGTLAGKATVVPDARTRGVGVLAGTAPWLVRRVTDRLIHKAHAAALLQRSTHP